VTAGQSSRDGSAALLGTDNGNALLVDQREGKVSRRYRLPVSVPLDNVFFVPRTHGVGLVASDVGRTWLVDGASGRIRRQIGASGSAGDSAGRWIVGVSGTGQVRLWNAETGARGPLLVDPRLQSVPSFSADGSYLVGIDKDGRVRLWSSPAGRLMHVFGYHKDGTLVGGGAAANDAAISPDHRWVVAAGIGGAVAWDRRHGWRPEQLDTADSTSTRVTFSPDSRRVLVGNATGITSEWDLVHHRRIATLEGHQSAVSAVSYNAAGTLVATGADDNTVRLWDATTGANVGVLYESGQPYALNFDASDTRLFSIASDNTARVYACLPCGDQRHLMRTAALLARRWLDARTYRQLFDAAH
jgi:WD40 repeat protein